jgi:streptomycin 3"-adenylyltransferase
MVDVRSTAYTQTVAARTADLLGQALVGVYLHGSAVLGGFMPSRSDIDLLVITTGPLDHDPKQQLRDALAPLALPCPATGLELSVVTRTTTLNPTTAPAFELHLATSHDTIRVVDGLDRPGDPDLLLHFAVCRDHAMTVGNGPAPAAVFGPVPRGWLLAGLVRELEWAEHHGTIEYRVLNACRAWRFAAEGAWCSKLDGGRWAHDRMEDPSVVDIALDRQQGRSDLVADPTNVSALVQHVLRQLHDEQLRGRQT